MSNCCQSMNWQRLNYSSREECHNVSTEALVQQDFIFSRSMWRPITCCVAFSTCLVSAGLCVCVLAYGAYTSVSKWGVEQQRLIMVFELVAADAWNGTQTSSLLKPVPMSSSIYLHHSIDFAARDGSGGRGKAGLEFVSPVIQTQTCLQSRKHYTNSLIKNLIKEPSRLKRIRCDKLCFFMFYRDFP